MIAGGVNKRRVPRWKREGRSARGTTKGTAIPPRVRVPRMSRLRGPFDVTDHESAVGRWERKDRLEEGTDREAGAGA